MKKLVLVLAVGLVSLGYHEASAQFSKGDNLINLGIGINSYYSGGIPIGASYEHGITEDISIGAGIDYLSHRYNFGSSRYGFAALYLGFRGSYHFNNLIKHNLEELDLYAGATLGYRSFSWKDDSSGLTLNDTYGNGLFLGAHLGARYYFKPNIGGFLELGAGGSGNARLGLAFKF
ncbi:MAG TPA: hypothetical protein DHV26_01550 [Cytophagales bacterium]|nr:hypothetical protein [Cytophagales bacterium]HRG11174.1 hypothetical protein [Cyclobacteriaceae bacterium]